MRSPGLYGFIPLLAIFIEIAGFIIVGRSIGVIATLGLLVLAMVIGIFLLRLQGVSLLQRIQNDLAAGKQPEPAMAQGAVTIIAAILLIIPGFVSDLMAIALLIPPVRALLWKAMSRYMKLQAHFSSTPGAQSGTQETVIDLDVEDWKSTDPEDSPWRPDNDTKRLK